MHLKDMEAALFAISEGKTEYPELTSSSRDVTITQNMEAQRPAARSAMARNKSVAPKLLAVQAAGWSVRLLSEKLKEDGVSISHNYLGKMLKGEAPISDEVRAGVRKLTKVRI
jgi:hypothetical protein